MTRIASASGTPSAANSPDHSTRQPLPFIEAMEPLDQRRAIREPQTSHAPTVLQRAARHRRVPRSQIIEPADRSPDLIDRTPERYRFVNLCHARFSRCEVMTESAAACGLGAQVRPSVFLQLRRSPARRGCCSVLAGATPCGDATPASRRARACALSVMCQLTPAPARSERRRSADRARRSSTRRASRCVDTFGG